MDPEALPQIVYNQLRSSDWTDAQLNETLNFPEGLPALRLRHPVRMSGSEIRLLLGHSNAVTACALLPDPLVGAAQELTHWLRSSRDRNLKALDMESAGLVASAFKRVNPTRPLVLRGISDYGDERKATLDSLGEGSLRRLAMHNATALLWTLLRTRVLPRATE